MTLIECARIHVIKNCFQIIILKNSLFWIIFVIFLPNKQTKKITLLFLGYKYELLLHNGVLLLNKSWLNFHYFIWLVGEGYPKSLVLKLISHPNKNCQYLNKNVMQLNFSLKLKKKNFIIIIFTKHQNRLHGKRLSTL